MSSATPSEPSRGHIRGVEWRGNYICCKEMLKGSCSSCGEAAFLATSLHRHHLLLYLTEAPEILRHDCAATDDYGEYEEGPEGQVPEEVPAGEEAEPYEGTPPHCIIWTCIWWV